MKNILYSIFFATTIMQGAASHLNEAELKATALYPVLAQLLPAKNGSKKNNPTYIIFTYLINRNPSAQVAYLLSNLLLLKNRARILPTKNTRVSRHHQVFCDTIYAHRYCARITTQNSGSEKPNLMVLSWGTRVIQRIIKLNHFGLYCPRGSSLICRTVKLDPVKKTVSVGFELNNAAFGYMQTFCLFTGDALTTPNGRPLVYCYTNPQYFDPASLMTVHPHGPDQTPCYINTGPKHTKHSPLHPASHLAPSFVDTFICNQNHWTCGFYNNPGHTN